MKILLTGGGGFLGYAVIRKLNQLHQIVCLDHGKNYKVLDKYFGKGIKLIKGDAQDTKLLKTLLKKTEIIIHLAGVAGERRCLENPIESNISNIYSTYAILDVAKSSNIKKIIFSSSYWVYSTYLKRLMPLSESSQLNTDSIYGAQKVISELMIKNSNIPFEILRIGATYGYGIDNQLKSPINNFIIQAFKRKPITIYGNGLQKVDFVYTEDIARVIGSLIKQKESNNVYNIGSGKPTSMLEVINILSIIFEKDYKIKVRIKKIKAPLGKVWPNKWLSIKKVQGVIKDYPFTKLEDGIRKTVKELEPIYINK